jgi:hypothetical protein
MVPVPPKKGDMDFIGISFAKSTIPMTQSSLFEKEIKFVWVH